MTSPVRARWEYQSAGCATMARQIVLGIPTLGGLLPDCITDILAFVGSPLHAADTAIRMIERANNLSCVLVNQCSYSMILQVGEEMDREMTVTIPWMEDALELFEAILPVYKIVNPLGGIAFDDRKHAYHANKNAYQTILDLWQATWEWKTSTITEVIDGDTIYVAAYDDPIRIEGINCPETCHEEYDDCDPSDEKWEAGYAARDYAISLLEGNTLHLRVRTERDYYDRLLAKVRIGAEDGPIFGNEMVKAGHARFYDWAFPSTLTH